MTIIERIRAEIERLKETAKLMKVPTYKSGWNGAMNAVLQLLSTIQEQPVCDGFDGEFSKFSNDVDAEHPFPICVDEFKDFARHFYELGCRRTAEKFDEIEYKRQREEEKPMNQDEDFRGEMREWVELMVAASFPEQDNDFITEGDYRSVIKQTARHFAQWQKEQMMKDGNVILSEEDFDAEKEKSMELGYNLCKEQMTKEAVETWMLEGSMFEPEFIKRKVIIIKEDK